LTSANLRPSGALAIIKATPLTSSQRRLGCGDRFPHHLRAYDSVSEARASIGRYFDFYNGSRPHTSLDGNTPDQAYFNPLPIRMAA
jgi:putative transposase